MRTFSFITALMLLIPVFVSGQTKQDETIKRSVTLFNPYKPTLQDATKRASFPPMDDTAKIREDFKYSFTPGDFAPVYQVSPIRPALLSPDPLSRLYKGYVKMGLGNYISPFIEISASNERSKKGAIGIYTRSYASAGKISLANSDRVFAGFMDNQAIVYGKKYFKRSRFDSDIDIRQMSRYAYGYDPRIIGYDAMKKDIRSLSLDMTGTARYFNVPKDSTELNYDVMLKYNYFSRGDTAVQNNPGIAVSGGKEVKGFYIGTGFNYDAYFFGGNLTYGARNLIAFNPYITKGTDEWRFRFGFDLSVDVKDDPDPLAAGQKNTHAYFYPNLEFTFLVVPKFMRFRMDLDGNMENNQAGNAIYMNPYLVHNDTLFTLKNTDNKLRLGACLEGSFDVNATYNVGVSYTLFNDMLMFKNDTTSEGNFFLPTYDDGELLKFHGETTFQIDKHINLTAQANYYKYSLTYANYAWHKPNWDATARLDYNLREKILATVSLRAIGQRYAMVKAPELESKLPAHLNLNLGVEYRYTKVLSFWAQINNISWNRYYEWNYYPAHNFMIIGGFTYSL
jgi:hypothetical protein